MLSIFGAEARKAEEIVQRKKREREEDEKRRQESIRQKQERERQDDTTYVKEVTEDEAIKWQEQINEKKRKEANEKIKSDEDGDAIITEVKEKR